MKQKIVFIVGPTATGKTDIAVRLAKKISGEIISCDSMQIYKGMDIITSKPSPVLMRKIPHYLIDIISPDKEYNVSQFRKAAVKKIREASLKGRIPLLVGGTGLYMSVLLDGIFNIKTENKNTRRKLYNEACKFGRARLHDRLKEIDPAAALKIHPNDTKRIIRALEVYEVTGKPISELQKHRVGLWSKYDVKIFCLNMNRDELNRRIEKRVGRMFKSGLVKEVKKLLKNKISRTASCAIGLKEIRDYLKGGYDLEAAKQLIARNTCLYAKRQLTWFRKDKRIEWVNIKPGDKPQQIARQIFNKL
ncbi:MAG: tRNA (adenosine(37)-N6)-dimethylallyltransferase MiaA [Candidatus Omnitrophota bacterium]|nr:tRNA (adenosine(37)-N6)-dimethylallyltransferase MiaA [Candidatus Omnitrophota bacterium]MBU1929814.1 tRNA (adenosine(37)-N6)-dimethylallyltransferase MiaA [Candidatus Omnitrophota bacterium]MBU2035184.1 tRNA (adenosine(37)-N6)-dimethylallyltransferase MiaA [Candidatus Omnitrophota bacterium]MBU2221340.1 tRNA (adenosine(37)-N6)-dimethylallyltransferase MiaA [Candidatus Omnitrophota bacterium]MBU2258650.1 tRNA (adenosine(37)-N6)-dimethylallyltransferase MiaA [Candidatus Omnitrophota bacterium